MPYAVADYRTRVRSILATAVDAATWTDDMVDSALREALGYASGHLPPKEVNVTCVDGREQDLSAISDLLGIAGVGWPWDDDEAVFRGVRWRWTDINEIHIEGGFPSGGDKLRLRYWRLLTINGLAGAVATTLPDRLLEPVAHGAAGYALFSRLRQVGEHPAPPQETGRAYVQLAGAWVKVLVDGVAQWGGAAPGPAWSDVGL